MKPIDLMREHLQFEIQRAVNLTYYLNNPLVKMRLNGKNLNMNNAIVKACKPSDDIAELLLQTDILADKNAKAQRLLNTTPYDRFCDIIEREWLDAYYDGNLREYCQVLKHHLSDDEIMWLNYFMLLQVTPSIDEPDNPDEYLSRRGVLEASREMGVTATTAHGRHGLRFPIRDAGGGRDRFRNLSSDGLKTYWLPGDYTPRYYYHPGRVGDAVTADNGRLYIASGEFDLLTFHSAGSYNVVAFSSENSVPDNLVEVLGAIGVQRVEYWPDADEAGLKSARKLHDLLTSAGIAFNAYDLSAHVKPGGDTNDLWITTGFDTAWFWRVLRACPLATLPNPPQPKRPRTYQPFDDSHIEQVKRGVVARLLHEPKAKQVRDEIICCSPFRDERNPSFSWNVTEGVGYDFGTAIGYSLQQMAEHYGIDS